MAGSTSACTCELGSDSRYLGTRREVSASLVVQRHVNTDRARVRADDPVDAFKRETAQLGGRILATWTEGASFASAESLGVRHVFGWSAEMGPEHHALVPYALRASAILAKRGDRSDWNASD